MQQSKPSSIYADASLGAFQDFDYVSQAKRFFERANERKVELFGQLFSLVETLTMATHDDN